MPGLENIVDVLCARSTSTDLAYVFLADGTAASETRWTFADTAAHTDALAAQLHDRGVRAGDRVLLAVNPGLRYIAALFGAMRLGAVPVPCYPPLRTKDIHRFSAITDDCTPSMIVTDPMYADRVAGLACGGVLRTDETPATAPTSPPRVSISPTDRALIQYTSGSTGTPKGVCLTHSNLVSNCAALGRSMGEQPGRIGLSWLPPYHDMGLLGTIVLSLYHGWPLVLMSPLHFVQRPRRWLEAITDYRVSVTVGPNFSLDLCAAALRDDTSDGAGELDLSTVRHLYCGAEPISADTLERFGAATAPLGFDMAALIPCYGMAEATLFVAGRRAGTGYRAASHGTNAAVVSCGTVDSAHTVRIVDPATRTPAADGQVGEIWVSGPSVAAGYHDNPELTDEVFHARLAGQSGQYLRTGDLGFIRDGELFVTGRIKDLIIVSGRNIYPQDVEAAALRADPSLRTAAAFAIPGAGTEALCVLAESTHAAMSAERHSAAQQAVRTAITAEFGVAPHIRICPRRTIPTTTSGKVRRQEARTMYLANRLPPVTPDAPAARGRPA
ncbi:MAG: fatty acyl-AMP ligase [Actinobacteria bacterium]|nr:fatty acyl-AMP ligase [Actinomycetota bacterium]